MRRQRAEGAMNWTDTTHSYSVSSCRHLGRPCPAVERMIARLGMALDQARPSTTDDFEITGTCLLERCDAHCASRCSARFVASHTRIRIFTGVDEDASLSGLDQFADAIFDPAASPFVPKRNQTYPSGLAQALPRRSLPSQPKAQAALASA